MDRNFDASAAKIKIIFIVLTSIGDFSTAKVLLDAGADINACGGQWGTALQAAYRCGYYNIIWKLYENGASHAIIGGKWGSALGSAISGACHTLVHQFVERHGVDVNQMCGRWGPALHFLIQRRDYDEEELVQLFLNSGADVNTLGGKYSTPLGASIVEGEPGLFEDLLKRGADPNLWWEKSGVSPLWLACSVGKADYVQQLIEHGANVHFCLPKKGTPLQAAARNGSQEIIQMLLDAGADINGQTVGVYGTALNVAVFSNNRVTVDFLLSRGADITRVGGRYHSVLQVAALKADINLFRFLLKKGGKVNVVGGQHRTPLQAACSAGRAKVAKILLLAGADPNIEGGVHGTALQAACANGKLILVRLLLSYGADPKLRGGMYGSALTAAAMRGDARIVKILLAQEGVTTEMLGEKKPHFKAKAWARTNSVLEAAVADKEPLEAFDVDKIKLPTDPEAIEGEALQSATGSGSEAESDTVIVQKTDSVVAATTEVVIQVAGQYQGEIASPVTMIEGEEETAEDMSALSWVQLRYGKGGDLDGEGR
jgi:ankyrin repeat protein